MRKLIKLVREYWSLIAGVAILVVLLSSCKGTKNIPIAHDTIYINSDVYRNIEKHDSIYVHDSVWMTIKGDTIWIDRLRERCHERVVVDTMRTTDTVYKSKEVPVEVVKVEYKIPSIAWILMGFLSFVIIILCRFSFKNFSN